jgi:uncharacterized protein
MRKARAVPAPLDRPDAKGSTMYENETFAVPDQRVSALERGFVTRVFTWMTWGLLLTAVVAAGVASIDGLARQIVGNGAIFIVLVIAELGLVVAISAGINRLSAGTAAGLFLLYSAVNGLTLSIVFLAFTAASITTTFLVTAGMFGATAAWGFLTNRDLSGLGSILVMGLVGLILASIVNLFFASSGLDWLLTYAGIAVFIGLTAYDMQKVRRVGAAMGGESEAAKKAAVVGALALYLDFINLFLLLLRLLERRR